MKFACLILLPVLICFGCKKEKSVLSAENNLLSFSADQQLGPANIDQANHKANLYLSYKANRAKLGLSIEVSAGAKVTINGVEQQGGQITADLSKPATMVITAQNGSIATWTITSGTDLEAYGLGTTVTADKSLNKTYNWYIDQYTSGTWWSVNCGPASVTMAAKWSDSTFAKTALDARNTYRTAGGWWYTTDIVSYLTLNNINWLYTTLPDSYQTMEQYLDKGNVLILCLDNYYLTYNNETKQHLGRFYSVSAAGSGHFIVVKGYKHVDGKVYFETYDPWSIAAVYAGTTDLKGQSRYYKADDLEQATNVWWDYAIVVAPKGKQVTAQAGVKTYALPASVPAQKGM